MIPEFVQDLVLEYLPVVSRFGISNRIDNNNSKKLNSAVRIIRRIVYNWALDYSQEMNTDRFEYSKLTYKRFYPMNMRTAFMESALDNLAHDQNRLINKFTFNEIIEELTQEEINDIGWA